MDAALDEPPMAVDLNTIAKQTSFDKEHHEVHRALARSLSPFTFSSMALSLPQPHSLPLLLSVCLFLFSLSLPPLHPPRVSLSLCLSLFSLSHVLFSFPPPFPICTQNTHTQTCLNAHRSRTYYLRVYTHIQISTNYCTSIIHTYIHTF
jgi:hypothetical protein